MKTKRFLTLAFCLIIASTMLFTTSCGAIKDLITGLVNTDEGGSDTREEARNDLIDDIGGVSETYSGTVSSGEYSSLTEAQEAFVADEITGKKNIEVVESVSKGELSSSEAEKLGVPSDVINSCLGIEEFEISYKNKSYAIEFCSASSEAEDTKTIKVYIIKYPFHYEYFSPRPETDQTITKSYYDSVFNSEKYKNCTVETTSTAHAITSGTVSMDMQMDSYQKIMHADGKIYIEISNKITYLNGDYAGGSDTQQAYLYLEQTETGIICYVREVDIDDDSGWVRGDLTTIGFSSVEQLTPFYDQYLDHTYFRKSEYGFVLDGDNAKAYVQAIFKDLGISDKESIEMGVDIFCEYFVKDGTLSGMESNFDFKVNLFGTTFDEQSYSKTVCKDYGSTVINRPEGIQ